MGDDFAEISSLLGSVLPPNDATKLTPTIDPEALGGQFLEPSRVSPTPSAVMSNIVLNGAGSFASLQGNGAFPEEVKQNMPLKGHDVAAGPRKRRHPGGVTNQDNEAEASDVSSRQKVRRR